MRKVGEGSFGRLAQTRRASKEWNARNIEVACIKCGYIAHFSIGSAAHFTRNKPGSIHDYWICKSCKAKDQAEVNAALIAIAKRKGLI